MKKQQIGKIILGYTVIALFCGLFSWVYEQFSHGVYSNYMIYLFTIPLIGGAAVFSLVGLNRRWPMPNRFSLNAYHAGIATLSVGIAMQGILEIYGTSSDYIVAYGFTGAVLIVIGAFSYCMMVKRDYRKRTFVKRST